jgi:hypothetical protein
MSLEPVLPWRNGKGWLSQNVLVVCDFDMQFRFVLPGWEGSAHDLRVLSDATGEPGLTSPPGKYFISDAGYTNGDWILTPFRGVKYRLREQWQSSRRSVVFA